MSLHKAKTFALPECECLSCIDDSKHAEKQRQNYYSCVQLCYQNKNCSSAVEQCCIINVDTLRDDTHETLTHSLAHTWNLSALRLASASLTGNDDNCLHQSHSHIVALLGHQMHHLQNQ